MPIAILEIPKASGPIDQESTTRLCEEAGEIVHEVLKVPDPQDKEIRVVESDSKATLRISFTVGPNEYPDFEPTSFSPTEEQIKLAGQSILEKIKDSQLDISRVVIEAWQDTTFVLREREIPEPVSPVSEETLREIGSHLYNPRMRLVLSPQKQEGVPSSKELGLSPENTSYQEVASKLSSRMTEILGRKEALTCEVEFAQSADTDVSVEFDCETEPNRSIRKGVRKYLAESVLLILDSNRSTKDGSGEVWIRQGQPKRYVFDK